MADRARAVGINHVALEVGDVDAALRFYGQLFAFELRGRAPGQAFIDLGDQFVALQEGRRQERDGGRHFGLVVDDKAAVHAALERLAVEIVPGRRLDFFDPWGNRVEVVEYGDVQFTKAAHVLSGMGLDDLPKTDRALAELADKGLGPDGR